ncbi:YncE family protein [Streptomyces sp. NPDC008079]|uniref:YncE family protein n=1 Tax=Streptomyces sp. NPDC008079 TaxID=3364806 RepID=UPI0036EAE2A6
MLTRHVAGGTALSVLLATASLLGVAAEPAAADSAATLPITSYSDMVVDGAHRRVFISTTDNKVVVADYNGKTVAQITSEPGAAGLVLSADSSTVYVALPKADAISAIDTATLRETARYPLGVAPRHLAMTRHTIWFGYAADGSADLGSLDLDPETDPTTPPTTPPPTTPPTTPPTDAPTPTPTDTTAPSPSPSDTPSDTPTDTPTDTPSDTPTDSPSDPPVTTSPTPDATTPAPPAPFAADTPTRTTNGAVVTLGQGGPHTWSTAPMLASSPGNPDVVAAGTPVQSPMELQVYNVSSGHAEPQAYRWNANNAGNMQDIALSADGKQVLVASGAPYFQQAYRTSDLADDGRYTTEAYPNAVAVAPDGTIAAGIDGAYEPDVYIFRPRSDHRVRTYDFGVVGNPGTASALVAGGLAWAPDSSRLFAVTADVYGQHPTLRVLTDPTKSVTAVTVSAPSTAKRATKITVSGKLTATTAFPAGAKVTVTRTDLTSPKGTSLGAKSVAANGTFSFTDTPTTGGGVTYTATYAGDATHTAGSGKRVVQVSRLATAASVKTNRATYAYGSTATVTGHLGKTGKSRVLSIWAQPAGGQKKLVKSAKVNAAGDLKVTYRLSRNTTFWASFAGDAVSAPKSVARSVGTQVSVSLAVSGNYGKGKVGSTSYYWFHKKKSALFTTHMTYANGRSQRLDLQVYYKGRWYSSGSEYFRLAITGTSRVGLAGPGESGIRARVRAVYVKGSSGDRLNTTTSTGWKYLYYTN